MKIVGWYVPEEFRPQDVSDVEWERDRIITVGTVDNLGGLLPDWEEKVVPVYIDEDA